MSRRQLNMLLFGVLFVSYFSCFYFSIPLRCARKASVHTLPVAREELWRKQLKPLGAEMSCAYPNFLLLSHNICSQPKYFIQDKSRQHCSALSKTLGQWYGRRPTFRDFPIPPFRVRFTTICHRILPALAPVSPAANPSKPRTISGPGHPVQEPRCPERREVGAARRLRGRQQCIPAIPRGTGPQPNGKATREGHEKALTQRTAARHAEVLADGRRWRR